MSTNTLIAAAADLADAVDALHFAPPCAYVYNPLRYAWPAHRAYLDRYGRGHKRVVFLGMNPGPYGMAQCGVPFGEIAAVRDWLGISEPIARPEREHPRRPVEGFACRRSEVSGRRLWGLFAARFERPAAFFRHHFVLNYCPLVFMEESGRNRTPDKLPRPERAALDAACTTHLERALAILRPDWLIGVGAYARERAARLDGPFQVGSILHPSPASPLANRGWAEAATAALCSQGVWPAADQ